MKTIGKYQLFTEIKRGPIAVLYKAYFPELDRIVFIKQLQLNKAADIDLLKRFQQEGTILAKLNHSNIINIFDYGISDNLPYLVMEYVEGVTLSELTQQNLMPLDISLFILYQICSGLSTLHQKQYIHRDVKPDNILISNEGIVKLGDFGFAESTSESNKRIWGTPAYMAPELILNEIADELSDIFSLGVVFYEMLTAENPFTAKKKADTFKNIVNLQPMAAHQIRSAVPDFFSDLCFNMLQKNPQKRIQSISAIIDKIAPYIKQISSNALLVYLQNSGNYSETRLLTDAPNTISEKKKSRRFIYVTAVLFFLIVVYFFQNFSKQKTANVDQFSTPPVDSIRIEKDKPFSENKLQLKQEETPSIKQLVVADNATPKPDNVNIFTETKTSVVLTISADPRARITINGDSIGISPVQFEVSYVPQTLKLTLKSPGLPLVIKEIEINAAEENEWFISLWQELGYLSVVVNPWGEIWIDGDSVDMTPLLSPILLLPGTHDLEIRHPTLTGQREQIFITANDTLKKYITLSK